MAHNIQFRNIEHGGLDFIETGVDHAICAYLGVTPDPVKWVESWYDILGQLLAYGKTPDEIRAILNDWIAQDRAAGHDGHVAHDRRLLTILNFIVMTYDVITFRTWGFA